MINDRAIRSSKWMIPKIGIGELLLFGTIYLESTSFSVESPIGRIRPDTVVIACIGFVMLFRYLIFKTKGSTILKASLFLAAYVGINVLALYKSASISSSLKVIFLLLSWLVVFLYLIKHCSTERTALKLVKCFLFFGIVQALIGVAQMQGEFIRPTGTIGSGDSDFFGLAIMGNLLIITTLQVLGVRVFGRFLDSAISILFMINLYFAFVRSAWLGYLAGIVFLMTIITLRYIGRIRVRMKYVLSTFFLAILVFITAFSLSPQLQKYFMLRISLAATGGYSIANNIRYQMMACSWNNAMASPIIGNGPAAFVTQGATLNIPFSRGTAFDPSIVTTLMNDTGIIGTGMFIIFLFVFYADVFRTYKLNPNSLLAKYALAFSISVFGLLISYIFTNGLWLPFSWVFFGFTTALAAAAKRQHLNGGEVVK